MAFLREGERIAWSPGVVAKYRDAADALEGGGTCGFCGRGVHAALKPMCSDCAGRESPASERLRAEVAAKDARIAELEASARYAVEALAPVAMTGKVPQGGEQTGNVEHLLWAFRRLGGKT